FLLARAAPGPRHDRDVPRARTRGRGAALVVSAPGRAVPLRALARRCKPRATPVKRADRRGARHAGCDRNRQGGPPAHLREGRTVRGAGSREAPRPVSGRPPARLGLNTCREKRAGKPLETVGGQAANLGVYACLHGCPTVKSPICSSARSSSDVSGVAPRALST